MSAKRRTDYRDEYRSPPKPDLETLPLFADLEPVPLARTTDPATSHQAAESMTEAAGVQRLAIVRALEKRAMTADELDQALQYRPTTSGRRLAELERMGRVSVTEETRATRSGRQARVYRIAENGPTR